ncbi:hypothetical protein SAMN04490239_0060 [Rhodococcus koreensis]|uniref:Uncharacterized protein n=2 Tax=Rhodococcus koreensis TaxID=99653 RepID=A0A1H4I5C3_9NOCA|nr:hypothetical protein SAMN04490239_0060 [Rhodococcus koreensis]
MKPMALLAVALCLGGLAALYYGWSVRSSDAPHLGTIPQWQVFVAGGVVFLVAALVQLALMVLELVARQRGSAQVARNSGIDV